MGNDSSFQANDSFLKQDWEPVERLPQFQIWQNKKDPSFRVQQYEISTQTDGQLSHQKRMFQLRRRSPLLVAAYYFQSQSKQQFCSTNNRHSLYLQRIPIRLQDIQHVPYPDYLHLYENCLKGFAQLARTVGYFPVDEGMIGFNERGVAKIWLSEDFGKSRPFSGRVTEENMIRSLIECIQRNVDSEQLPRSVPSIRNYLYRNVDALNFDTAIWEFMQFVNKFNSGRIPSRLDCIQKAGGIYVIANRQQYKYDQSPINIQQQQQQVNSVQHQQFSARNQQIPVNTFKHYNPEVPISSFQESNQFNSVLIQRVKNNNWSVEKQNTPNRAVIVDTRLNQDQLVIQNHQVITSPRNNQNIQRRLFNQPQQFKKSQTPNYLPQFINNSSLPQNTYQQVIRNQSKPQSHQTVRFGNHADSQVVYPANNLQGTQPYQIPINHSVNQVIVSPRSSQIHQSHQNFHAMPAFPIRKSQTIPVIPSSPQNQPQPVNQSHNRVFVIPQQQQHAFQPPQYFSRPPIVNVSPHSQVLVQASSEVRMPVPQTILPQPQVIQVPPTITTSSVPQQTVYTPRSSNIIKYTVQVTPGKVIPQKSSTIMRKSSIKNSIVENTSSQVKQGGSLLDNCFHKIATSQKQVQKQSNKMIQPSPIPERSQHLEHQQGGDLIRSKQALDINDINKRDSNFPNKLKISETVILVNPSDQQDSHHNNQQMHSLSQRAAAITSYEQRPVQQRPINNQTHNVQQQEFTRQQLMSVWTAAGNHKSPINQIQSSFNPAVQYDNEEDYNEQAQFQQQDFAHNRFNNQPVSQIKTQEYSDDYERYDNIQQEQIRQTANFNQQAYNQNNYDEKEIRETGYFQDYQNHPSSKISRSGQQQLKSFASPNQYNYYEYNDYDSHGLKNQGNSYVDYSHFADKETKQYEQNRALEGISQDYKGLASVDRHNASSTLKTNYEKAREQVEYNPSSGSYTQYLQNLTGQRYASNEMDYFHSVASKNPNYSELTSFEYYRPGLSSTQNYLSNEDEHTWQR